MIMKALGQYLHDLPKLELGDVSTRANRLLSWKSIIDLALIPVGAQLRVWWKWCLEKAGIAYRRFLAAGINERESIQPTEPFPEVWVQIDSWMRPKLLEAIPQDVKNLVESRHRQGKQDDTHHILFWVHKIFCPGSMEEKLAVTSNIINPRACSNPKAAQSELIKWKENIRRSYELELAAPDVAFSYRALASIFSAVFDKAEPMLFARWIALKNELGLPHRISQYTMEKVSAFAEAELGALALVGNNSQNPGLPLTDNQKARNSHQKDQDQKKRVAAAKVNAPPATPAEPAAKAAAVFQHKTSTHATWAVACKDWEANGICLKGKSFHFKHEGFLRTDNRCLTCGTSGHTYAECVAPGGKLDPKKDAVWTAYKERQAKALKTTPGKSAGKGKDKGGDPWHNYDKKEGKGKDQGKGKGKGKGKNGQPRVNMLLDDEVSRASATITPPAFPRDCIGLDSWANVHLSHQKPYKGLEFKDKLSLACGPKVACTREVGAKGIPRVLVPFAPSVSSFCTKR